METETTVDRKPDRVSVVTTIKGGTHNATASGEFKRIEPHKTWGTPEIRLNDDIYGVDINTAKALEAVLSACIQKTEEEWRNHKVAAA
jgi:hypothetical protein